MEISKYRMKQVHSGPLFYTQITLPQPQSIQKIAPSQNTLESSKVASVDVAQQA